MKKIAEIVRVTYKFQEDETGKRRPTVAFTVDPVSLKDLSDNKELKEQLPENVHRQLEQRLLEEQDRTGKKEDERDAAAKQEAGRESEGFLRRNRKRNRKRDVDNRGSVDDIHEVIKTKEVEEEGQ